jgi:hypothetical protein
LPLVTVNTSGLRDAAAALRHAARRLPTAHRTALREGAEKIAVDARAKASWSIRIPGSVRVKTFGRRISVTADAPNAAPLENRGKRGTFKHPVFGNADVVVEQEARPFLHPAAELNEPKLVDGVLQAIDKTMTEAGFK